VHVNDRRLVTRDYAYFFENQLRKRYRLEGVPLVIDFADRENPARPHPRSERAAARAA
jgi:GTP-binding protein